MEIRKRGFTLIEIVIYFGLSTIVVLAILSIFAIAKRGQQATYSSYLVSGRTYSALTVLRRDLQNTALSSIRAYPNRTNSAEQPGLACPSPFGFTGDKKGQLQLNAHGAPDWQKMVHYTVRKSSGKVGALMRWNQEYKAEGFLPKFPGSLPSNIEGSEGSALLEDVLMANQTISGVGEGGTYTTDSGGGFDVKFVRRQGGSDAAETLSSENPSEQDPAGNTRLVQVTLKILRDQKSSKPTLYVLKLRACPRY